MSTADVYTAEWNPSDGGGNFTPAPEGTQQLVCVDGIYLGQKIDSFQGGPPKIVPKYAYVYQTADVNPETGKRYEISIEFTISMHENARLRKWLSTWRGKTYTDDEARRVELHKPIGVNGIGAIERKVSGAGRTYGKLTNIGPLMRGMQKIVPEGYERAPYWEERKREYAAGVEMHRAQLAQVQQTHQTQLALNGSGAAKGGATPPPGPVSAALTPHRDDARLVPAGGGSDDEVPF